VGQDSFLTESLGRVAEALERAKIDYALAGGLAFSALVQPRATVDIDLLSIAGQAPRDAILEALSPLFEGLMPHAEPMTVAGASIWRVVGIEGKRELIIDFVMSDSDFYRDALRRKLVITFHEHRLPIVTVEDLYLLKRLADRPQDRVDVEAIEQRFGHSLDWTYVTHWLGRWNLSR
jgi:hypothetical protein